MSSAINSGYTQETKDRMIAEQQHFHFQKFKEIGDEYAAFESQLNSYDHSLVGLCDERIQSLQEQLGKRDEKIKLIHEFANVNIQIIKAGRPPLAYKQENVNKIEVYLNIQKKFLFKNITVASVLRHASACNKLVESEFRLLCSLAPGFDCQSSNGNNPLHWSITRNYLSHVKIVLECGQTENKQTGINQQNKEGLTPLHLAALKEIDGFVKCLFQYRVVPNLVNNKGESALKYAKAFFNEAGQQPGLGYTCLKSIMEAFDVVCNTGGTQLDKIHDLHPLINWYLCYKT